MLAENRKIGYITKHEASKTSTRTAFTPSALIFYVHKFSCLVVCFDISELLSYGREGAEYNTRKGNNAGL
ncbi:hypothetical protein MM710_37650, partial [Klebsiella pneumoniae]|nr:hypothetical protein [Klebsiella pneumoniae]